MPNNKTRILLIEDDSFLLSMYATQFELENFNVITAENGEKGLKLAKKEIPEIILLDIMLPEMNGFDVLKELKLNKATSQIPVILLTNLSQKSEIEQGLAMNVEGYLIKAHFMPSEVVDKVKQVLSK
ncbi:MAG: response regulator [Patescibacteria group bacterium]|nr:response regulator [Patescibacteria group bacterium]